VIFVDKVVSSLCFVLSLELSNLTLDISSLILIRMRLELVRFFEFVLRLFPGQTYPDNAASTSISGAGLGGQSRDQSLPSSQSTVDPSQNLVVAKEKSIFKKFVDAITTLVYYSISSLYLHQSKSIV